MSNIQLIEYRIGRNVNGTPMAQPLWNSFVAECVGTLEGVATGLQADTISELTQWTEVHISDAGRFDGELEESAVVTLYTDADVDLSVHAVLVDFAAEAARRYHQVAVALVWEGRSTLVGPAPFELLTAAQTAAYFPVGTTVWFAGYEDGVGKSFEAGTVLEVVGHDDTCGSDGLVARDLHGSAAKADLVFASEVIPFR